MQTLGNLYRWKVYKQLNLFRTSFCLCLHFAVTSLYAGENFLICHFYGSRTSKCHINWACLSLIPLTISYHLYFLLSLKFGALYIIGQWGKFRVKNAVLCLATYTFGIFIYFFYFSSNNLCFYHFHLLCWWSISFFGTGNVDKK